MGRPGQPLSLEVMWKAKQMYEERDERGDRIWSHRKIAKHLGISETSVLRAVNGEGRFGNSLNAPLPEVKTEEQLNVDAAASLEKLQRMLREEKEREAGQVSRADEVLEELKNKGKEVDPKLAKAIKDFL